MGKIWFVFTGNASAHSLLLFKASLTLIIMDSGHTDPWCFFVQEKNDGSMGVSFRHREILSTSEIRSLNIVCTCCDRQVWRAAVCSSQHRSLAAAETTKVFKIGQQEITTSLYYITHVGKYHRDAETGSILKSVTSTKIFIINSI